MKIVKKKNDKYQIELEDGTKIETYSDVILNNNILYKKELNNNELNKIEKETNYYNSYNKVLKFTLKKIRSIKETKEYIIKQNINDGEKIINELKQINMLNDEMFSKSFVNDHFYLTKEGPLKIYSELLKHDIKEQTINESLNIISQDQIKEKVTKYITKKISSNTKYSNKILREKILNELICLGYNKELIVTTFNNYKNDDIDIVKKEYDKLYKKYSKKYTGYELKYHIKQAMYQKGLDIEKIQELD